jgi:hypothetical protein
MKNMITATDYRKLVDYHQAVDEAVRALFARTSGLCVDMNTSTSLSQRMYGDRPESVDNLYCEQPAQSEGRPEALSV